MKTDVLLEPRSIKIILLIHGRGRISSCELMDIGSKYCLAHRRARELESMGILVSFPDDRLQSKVNWELTPKGGAVATLLQIVEDLGHGFHELTADCSPMSSWTWWRRVISRG